MCWRVALRRDVTCPDPGSNVRGFTMTKFANSVKKFLVSEDGPTAVEYAVMLALIVVVCLASVSAVGSIANARFNKVSSYLS
jgi:pilus assembly protein Flp/PilA